MGFVLAAFSLLVREAGQTHELVKEESLAAHGEGVETASPSGRSGAATVSRKWLGDGAHVSRPVWALCRAAGNDLVQPSCRSP